jgi:eukaryotic-like serine/threonine-protein kinase
MSREHPPSDDASPSRLIEINRICDRFEAAWRAGRRSSIEEHLAEMAEPTRSDLLRELLATELELRQLAGESPGLVEYRTRFAGHATLVETAFSRAGLVASSSSPPPQDTGRNLLFGLLALQNNFIDRDVLLAAFNAWLADKSRPLGDILRERGALDGARHTLLEALVGEHLRLHGDDPERSLAALDLSGSTRESLRKVGDPDLDASLAHAGSAPAHGDPPPVFAGQSTSTGGRFRVLRPHARGGLGQVYVAHDEELGRQVALKEILVDKAGNPGLRSRFVLEAEINGNLEHPGIVPVYGLGTYGDGRPFYAMRFIEGDSLKEAIANYHVDGLALDATASNLRLRQLLGRFVDVCDAIAYAHSRGILHRDLKPANIMLGPYGETLIIDWGLAKAVGKRDPNSASGETTLVPPSGDSHEPTMAGNAIGSPPYMSPEQAEGKLDQLGTATDVYGLGATLYALLTGKAPVAGATVDEVLFKVRTGSIIPPRQLKARVPRALEAVCLKALALNPSDRYPSARALADDIEHWLADEPVSALPEPLTERARRWTRRHRTLVTTAAAVLFLGLIGLAAFAAVVSDKNRKLVAANEATKKAEILADTRLDRAMASIEDYFTGVSEEALKGGQLPTGLRDRLLAKPREFYEQLTMELAAKPNPSERERSLLASGQFNLGRVLETLGKYKESRAQGEAALAIYEELVRRRPDSTDYRHGVARSHRMLATVLDLTGLSDEATRAYGKAITIGEALAAQHPDVPEYRKELAHAYLNLAIALASNGRSDEAAGAYKKAIAISEALASRHPDVPEYKIELVSQYGNLGALFTDTGRYDDAIDAHGKALRIGEALTERYPDVSEYRHWIAVNHGGLANVYDAKGRTGDAIEAHGQVVTIYEGLTTREPGVPDYKDGLGRGYLNLGNALLVAGRPDEAAAACRKAVATFGALSARDPDVPEYSNHLAHSQVGLGNVLAAAGRPGEAAAAYRQAAADFERLSARYPSVPNHLDGLANSHIGLGNVLAAAGRPDEAAAAYRQAITTAEKLVAQHLNIPEYLNILSLSHNNLGLFQKTEGGLVDALASFRRAAKFARPGTPLAAALPGQIRDTETEIALTARLPAVLKGEDKSKDADESLAFAKLCRDRSRYATATRFWAETFAADPRRADDREVQYRYNAACAAALAAAGKGKDEPALDEAEKARLRIQSRDWLKAELAAWTAVLKTAPAQVRATVVRTMEHWQKDSDLAGIRDPDAIEKLPEAERKEWRDLWAEVARLIEKARASHP